MKHELETGEKVFAIGRWPLSQGGNVFLPVPTSYFKQNVSAENSVVFWVQCSQLNSKFRHPASCRPCSTTCFFVSLATTNAFTANIQRFVIYCTREVKLKALNSRAAEFIQTKHCVWILTFIQHRELGDSTRECASWLNVLRSPLLQDSDTTWVFGVNSFLWI